MADYRVIVDLETYRKIRGWFSRYPEYSPKDLKGIMHFLMIAETQEEADDLAEYYEAANY